MNERFLILMEKNFENILTDEEKVEFENLLATNNKLKSEFEDQKRVKEVLSKMKLSNPQKEVWDGYWMGLYNKIERGIAWIAVSIGLIILLAAASYEIVDKFISDTGTPGYIKFGTAALVFGIFVLFISVLREKLFTYSKDKYKEIKR
ncbi:MAG: hypothetical protein K9J12_03150 [Melioribacteraceae bacterium]|nr:hypothetical protein [Melioribacteraceae bacterium]MCF8265772.1 hypothetical protein [Melioribacteraceae bacterium]MCF8412498.1 hypothetical protein [Melioribacteraceae bacterium]MCF8431697.1 hypothetical protein [Melioribacteraceae bacterium]